MVNLKCSLYMQVILLSQFVSTCLCGDADNVAINVNSRHPCLRTCENTTMPMVCHYKFKIENYITMSKACYDCPYNITDCYRPDCVPTNGVKRTITVVNRSLPGPSIQVCLGDKIVVDMTNGMFEESTTVHWHGLHQLDTPYMDGVPFLTQCPVPPHQVFRYEFEAATSGTHFWHSHMGCQRSDGAFGALIIRKPYSEEFHSSFYTLDLPEHVIQVADWTHQPVISKMMEHFHAGGNNKPDSILVNGRGRYKQFKASRDNTIYTPLTTFNVQKGIRYRFRIINAGFLNCPIQISFDNHGMIIINSDGSDIQPVFVDTLVSYAGERWDIIINANQNIGNYWIRFRGLLDCGPNFNSVFSAAVLHYVGAPDDLPELPISYNNSDRNGLELNALNKGSGEFDFASVAEIKDVDEYVYDPALIEVPDVSLTLGFDFYPIDNPLFHKENLYGFYQVSDSHRVTTPQINHISLALPSFPLLSQRDEITSDTFCNATKMKNCNNQTHCHCTYTIDIPLNKAVEIILIDIGKVYEANHPFHLHGHSFRVVALEKLGSSTSVDEVKSLDESGKIFRNLRNPPVKDTVTIPDGGFTIIRFYASNPGFWLLHCHLDFHLELGMAVILNIGHNKDIPPVPKHFPKCGNYYYSSKSRHWDKMKCKNALDCDEDETNSLQSVYSKILQTINTAPPRWQKDCYLVLLLPIILYFTYM